MDFEAKCSLCGDIFLDGDKKREMSTPVHWFRWRIFCERKNLPHCKLDSLHENCRNRMWKYYLADPPTIRNASLHEKVRQNIRRKRLIISALLNPFEKKTKKLPVVVLQKITIAVNPVEAHDDVAQAEEGENDFVEECESQEKNSIEHQQPPLEGANVPQQIYDAERIGDGHWPSEYEGNVNVAAVGENLSENMDSLNLENTRIIIEGVTGYAHVNQGKCDWFNKFEDGNAGCMLQESGRQETVLQNVSQGAEKVCQLERGEETGEELILAESEYFYDKRFQNVGFGYGEPRHDFCVIGGTVSETGLSKVAKFPSIIVGKDGVMCPKSADLEERFAKENVGNTINNQTEFGGLSLLLGEKKQAWKSDNSAMLSPGVIHDKCVEFNNSGLIESCEVEVNRAISQDITVDFVDETLRDGAGYPIMQLGSLESAVKCQHSVETYLDPISEDELLELEIESNPNKGINPSTEKNQLKPRTNDNALRQPEVTLNGSVENNEKIVVALTGKKNIHADFSPKILESPVARIARMTADKHRLTYLSPLAIDQREPDLTPKYWNNIARKRSSEYQQSLIGDDKRVLSNNEIYKKYKIEREDQTTKNSLATKIINTHRKLEASRNEMIKALSSYDIYHSNISNRRKEKLLGIQAKATERKNTAMTKDKMHGGKKASNGAAKTIGGITNIRNIPPPPNLKLTDKPQISILPMDKFEYNLFIKK